MKTHFNIFADKCSAASTDCRNGGYPNPRNCNKCNCPSGFGGDFCTEPQTTEGRNCGQRLTASESWQDLEATVGEHSYYTDATVWKPTICSWHLTVSNFIAHNRLELICYV